MSFDNMEHHDGDRTIKYLQSSDHMNRALTIHTYIGTDQFNTGSNELLNDPCSLSPKTLCNMHDGKTLA